MPHSISSSHVCEVPWDFSFSGSGFLATYQLGAVLCFLKYAPWILQSAPHILGASAGSLVAAAVVCKINPTTIRDEIILFAKKAMTFRLGPLNPSVNVFQWLESVLRKHLPSDAHHFASGRLGVAVTRLSDGKHLIMSEFQSKEDVVEALLCSCFVPGYCGFLPPTFKGVHYIDGGLSRFQPLQSEASSRTITVCPFSGEADICPVEPPCMMELVATGAIIKFNMANSFRFLNSLYPVTLECFYRMAFSEFEIALSAMVSLDEEEELICLAAALKKQKERKIRPLNHTRGEEGEYICQCGAKSGSSKQPVAFLLSGLVKVQTIHSSYKTM